MGYTVNEFGQKVFDDFTFRFWSDVLWQNSRNVYCNNPDFPWAKVDSITVIADKSVYTFYPGIHKGDLGFGGTKFIFTSPDGKEYLTNNCWHRGDVEDIPPTILEKFSEPWTMRCP